MKIRKLVEELPGDNGNAFSGSKRLYRVINVNESTVIARGGQVYEGIDIEIGEKEKGGIIVFSTDVNAVTQSDNKIIDWLKKKAKTVENRLGYKKKVDGVAQRHKLPGWTVGKFLDGRYTAHSGKVFGENSLSVEIVGVPTDELIHIAEELCNLFDQETVMVKDYTSGKIFIVNGE